MLLQLARKLNIVLLSPLVIFLRLGMPGRVGAPPV